MACSLTNTKKLFRKNNILNRFDELTEDTGAKVSQFNQLAFQVRELAVAKYGNLPQAALRPIRLEGRKAIFNPNFFDWVDMKNAELQKQKQVPPTSEDQSSLFYQLQDPRRLESNDQNLDQFLLDFLSPFGVQAEQINDYKERFGADSLAVTDVLNKLIFYSENRNIETIPEEFGHMISFLMGPKHPLMEKLLSEITNWERFAEVYRDYYEKYDYNVGKVKLEAIGKVIAERLVAQYKKGPKSENALTRLIDKIIHEVMMFLSKFYKSGYYSRYLADKIAAEVLMGNRDFVYNGYLSGIRERADFAPVDFNKSLQENPHAKFIVTDYGEKLANPLVGSLAIAGQGERILRSPNEPIHDLDFIVESDDKFQVVMQKLLKDNAVPIHFGWSNNNKSYTTYAYFIPAEGHTITVLKRDPSGWISKDSLGKYMIEVRDSNGNIVEATPQNVIPVDFFVYPNDAPFKETVVENIFSSWQDIFHGKLTLSPIGEKEFMFKRDKDQIDYVFNNPVSRAVKPHPMFLFYQLDSNRNTIDPTAVPDQGKLQEQYSKQLLSLQNRLKELQEISGGKNRLEVAGRINVIKNSIESLEGLASVAKLLNVAFYDIASLKLILNKPESETTAFDLNEAIRIISVLENFDIAMSDIVTEPKEKQYVLAIRNALAESIPAFQNKLMKVVEGIAKMEGFDISYKELTKAYEDISKTASLIYSPEDSHIPLMRIAASVLNQFQSDTRDEEIKFKLKEDELRKKYANFDFSTILENGHLILPYKEEYYEAEAKLFRDIKEVQNKINEEYKKAEEENRDPDKIKIKGWYEQKNAYEAIKFNWYKENHVYYLSSEMEERYKADLEAKKKELLNPITGEFDEEAFESWEKEYSPYRNRAGALTNQTVEIAGETFKTFNVIATSNVKERWYRYLTITPKTEGKIDWSNPLYDKVKDNEMYQFIVQSLAESVSKVPHQLYIDSSGPHKFIRSIQFDATSNTFAFRSWGKDVLKMTKDWASTEVTLSDIEDRYKGITDYAGREKASLRVPNISRIEGAKDPLDLTRKFYNLATAYDYKTRVVPITDLLQYQLSQMGALRMNTLTGQMMQNIINGSQTEPAIIEKGLINAMSSLKYKTDSVLSERTRLDEQKLKISPEEIADLEKRQELWEKEGRIGPRPTLRKISATVIADSVTDFTRLNLIGLKPHTAAANLLMGLSSTFIYAARNKEYNDQDAWWAFTKVFQTVLKFSHKSRVATPDAIKIGLFAEHFGIITNLYEGQGEQKSKTAAAITKFMYLLQERGEYLIHTQLMLAMMHNQKVTTKNGQTKNLWDAFLVKTDSQGNQYLVWDEATFGPAPEWNTRQVLNSEGLNVSKRKKFEQDLRKVRIATQGDYQNALLGKSVWQGRMLFLFRTWLPSAIRQRFGKEIEGEFKGRYITYSDFTRQAYRRSGLTGVFGFGFKTIALATIKTFNIAPFNYLGMNKISKVLTESYEKQLEQLGMSTIDIENMRSNVRELQFILFIAMLVGALKQLDDDDEDPTLVFLINLGNRLNTDLTFFVNPASFMSTIKDPIGTWKTAQDVADVTTAIVNYVQDPESDTYVRGKRKGKSKLAKNIMDLFPGISGMRAFWNSTEQKFSGPTYKYK